VLSTDAECQHCCSSNGKVRSPQVRLTSGIFIVGTLSASVLSTPATLRYWASGSLTAQQIRRGQGWPTRGAVGTYALKAHRLKVSGQPSRSSTRASTSVSLRDCLEKRSYASYVNKAVTDIDIARPDPCFGDYWQGHNNVIPARHLIRNSFRPSAIPLDTSRLRMTIW
jgi:hypothetical protein